MPKALRQLLVILLLALALAACGASQPDAPPTAAPPSATPFPTFAFVEPTKPPAFGQIPDDAEQEGSDAAAIALDPKKVERGKGRYEALACGECHGAGGEGTDQAPSLQAFSLSEDDFITFMRSGGDLGPEHQFSTDRLSNSGSRNLYHYLVSLAVRG